LNVTVRTEDTFLIMFCCWSWSLVIPSNRQLSSSACCSADYCVWQ